MIRSRPWPRQVFLSAGSIEGFAVLLPFVGARVGGHAQLVAGHIAIGLEFISELGGDGDPPHIVLVIGALGDLQGIGAVHHLRSQGPISLLRAHPLAVTLRGQ